MGFKARAWRKDHKPKYLVLGDGDYGWPRYHISRSVFGLNKVLDFELNVAEDPRAGIPNLNICEGELNVMALWQINVYNSVAVSGSNFSDYQARLIRRYADSVTIFFDSDTAGNDGTAIVIEALKPYMPVRVVPDHEGDPASMDEDSVRSLLQDAESASRIMLESKLVRSGQ
jgi:DNA primase